MANETELARKREWKREHIAKALEYFRYERYECTDEIPEFIVTPTNDPLYIPQAKVQKNIFYRHTEQYCFFSTQ